MGSTVRHADFCEDPYREDHHHRGREGQDPGQGRNPSRPAASHLRRQAARGRPHAPGSVHARELAQPKDQFWLLLVQLWLGPSRSGSALVPFFLRSSSSLLPHSLIPPQRFCRIMRLRSCGRTDSQLEAMPSACTASHPFFAPARPFLIGSWLVLSTSLRPTSVITVCLFYALARLRLIERPCN